MSKRWVIKDQEDTEVINNLSQALDIDTTLARLLVQRGITNFDEAKSFFRPDINDLHDPFLMKDMPEAIERIEKAIRNNENILVYGDYDVDGTTSVALMYAFLSEHHSNIYYYIPDRDTEGYGVSFKGIDYASDKNCGLIIALDCGIKANEKIEYAKKKNIDFIICDHHYPGDVLPPAIAILDPKREDCSYPYKHLSGCGVGFKLIQAYAKINGIGNDRIYPYLDLVAVSIASDIVPVVEENRILAFYGLQQLSQNPRTGLKAILKIAGLESVEITIEDIVFRVGPRINAAGRLESGKSAVELLIEKDIKVASKMASEIDNCNNARRNIDRSITQEALRMISNNLNLRNSKSTVLFNAKWHKGVVGIVASRLIENYYRPTVVLTESNGYATGSARSVIGFDLYKAVDMCSDLLESFGGHMYAAGLTMKVENIPAFMERFEKIVSETIKPEQLIPQVNIDTKLDFAEITPKFFRILKQFKPFGPENMSPAFYTENVIDTGEGKIVGSSGEHIKLTLKQLSTSEKPFPAIAFQQAHNFFAINDKKKFDICYTLEENHFRGSVNLQLNIKDIKSEKDNDYPFL